MAREPQPRRPQASAQDDFYGEEIEGQNDRGQGDDEGTGEAEDDAALNAGAEQEIGDEEDLGVEGDDFFDEEPEPRQTRGGQRIQVLANENRELRRERDELRRGSAPQPSPARREETDQEFETRIKDLSWEEKYELRYNRDRTLQARRDAARDFQAADEKDRNKFEAETTKNRFAAKLRDRVEEEFQDRMRRGQPVSRMDLYFWLRGQMADKTSVKDVNVARQQARERVNRNTVPIGRGGGGSDVEAPRGRRQQLSEREQRARRLENQQI